MTRFQVGDIAVVHNNNTARSRPSLSFSLRLKFHHVNGKPVKVEQAGTAFFIPSTVVDNEMCTLMNYDSTERVLRESLPTNFVLTVTRPFDQSVPRLTIESYQLPPLMTAQLIVTPQYQSISDVVEHTSMEIIFLLDQSGSMWGSLGTMSQMRPIDGLKEAMRNVLPQLPRKCKFNIVSFGSQHTSLFDKSKLYTEETFNFAMAYLSTRVSCW
jgi:hypothetical protein